MVPEPQAQLSADLTDFCGDAFEPGLEYTGTRCSNLDGRRRLSGRMDHHREATVLTLVVTTEVLAHRARPPRPSPFSLPATVADLPFFPTRWSAHQARLKMT